MQNKKLIGIIVAVVILFIIISSSTFVVRETDQVIITQFGKPVGEPIAEPGIHFKIPMIQNFDQHCFEHSRIRILHIDNEDIPMIG